MIDFGRFLAWDTSGIEEVLDFASKARCFVSINTFDGWPDVWILTVWATPFCDPNKGDARALFYVKLLNPMQSACFYENK